MERERALEICRAAVACATTDDVLASLVERTQGATRFSNDAITQNVADRRSTLTVRAAVGKCRGEVTTTRFDGEGLRAAVARAEAVARVAPEDDEHLPPVAPAEYRDLPGALEATAATPPDARSAGVAAAIRSVREAGGEGVAAAGAYTTGGTARAFANSRGAEGWHAASHASIHATVLTGTSSGWAEEVSRDGAAVDPARTALRARDLAVRAARPREVPPGEYPVVLGPAAVCELLGFLAFSLDAKAADEGRSALSGKEGTRIASEKVTIRSVLGDPSWPGMPFDAEGVPLDDLTWVDRGVLRHLQTSRYWAERTSRRHTPWPGTVTMDGTDRSTEDLVASLDRGLYVTRFWYTRHVDPMALLLTGMTRDALFLVEGGRIVSGVKHLRYNDSPLRVFSAVREVGRPEVASMYVRGLVPALLVDSFRFTSGTTF